MRIGDSNVLSVAVPVKSSSMCPVKSGGKSKGSLNLRKLAFRAQKATMRASALLCR